MKVAVEARGVEVEKVGMTSDTVVDIAEMGLQNKKRKKENETFILPNQWGGRAGGGSAEIRIPPFNGGLRAWSPN